MTEIREKLKTYQRLNRELDEIGGPEKNGELFETIIYMEEDILKAVDLPPAKKNRSLLWEKDMDDIITKLEEAREEYDSRPIHDPTLMLMDAIFRHIDEPENILPMAGFSHHTYQIFLFSEKLLSSEDLSEIEKIIAEMKRAEEHLNDLGLLSMGGIRSYPDLYRELRDAGFEYLDEFLMHNDKFDLDDEDMDVRQFFLRGILNARNGNKDDAIRDFSSALKLRPDKAVIYYHRALAYESEKDLIKAFEDYSKAIEIDPEYYMALCNRGILLAFADQCDEAMKDFNHAIEAGPDMPFAYINRGNLYAELAKFELSIEDFTRAIALDPDIAYLYCNRGISFYRLGKKERALEDLEKSASMGHDLAKKALDELFPTEGARH